MRERDAWCTLDANGDLVDMARIVTLTSTDDTYGGRAVLINRHLLDRYAVITRACLVRMFDFTHFSPGQFSSWETNRDEVTNKCGGLIYRQWIQSDASFARGVQLIMPELTEAELFAEDDLSIAPKSSRRYASFIAQDWKNKQVREISCSPDAQANYFTESDKPFETTPAFFRPEVLLKYKADTTKYTVESRSISCRGSWHLESYDINRAGQVHTYLVYLSRLPYEEQLYWRSFNEHPKAPISERAFISDFKGEFAEIEDPLEELKAFLRSLVKRKVPWWTLRDEDLIRQLTAPATSSADEWANDLMNLDKSIVEGLQEKWLRRKAQELGRNLDDRVRALKALEECLVGLQFEADHARTLLTPLHEVHNLRSEQKSHPAGASARETREKILSEYRTYRNHFIAQCRSCLESMTVIDRAFK